jgi:hypothetical protein
MKELLVKISEDDWEYVLKILSSYEKHREKARERYRRTEGKKEHPSMCRESIKYEFMTISAAPKEHSGN